jgi:hypothetical protein
MVQTNTFLGIEGKDHYHHLQQFEQTCDCLHIEGMSDETIHWKLFPFTLKGKAREWYDWTKEKMKGDWGTLRADFCMDFYPLSKVVDLRIKIISFKQGDNESMSSSWEHFELLCKSGPDLSLQLNILLQHFYIGLNKKSRAYLNTSSHGSFIHLTSSEARTILDNILANTNDGPLEEKTIEEEIPKIDTPEPMLEASQPIAIQNIESPQEEIPLPDFIMISIMETPRNIIKRRGLESTHLIHICDINRLSFRKKLVKEGHTGKLDVCLGETIKVPLHFSHSIHKKTESSPKPYPMEEVNEASLEHFIESNQEDVTEFFIEEEEENPIESEPLDETEEPSRTPIELKPLPPGLRYAFLHNDSKSPVIINDKLTQEESHRLITMLEQHRSAFGYSLQDLKGISPALCTHRITTDPHVLPSREPQRRLNNAMRER